MKSGFHRPVPLVLIIIGVYNLVPDFKIAGVPSENLFWPALLIVGGIMIVMRGKKKDALLVEQRENYAKRFEGENPETETTNENFVNIEALFGGRKEIITSKQFGGCNATAICGGAEINLMQADSAIQPMVLDLRVLFGGIEIIVPSHWEVVNEVDVLFGGIEDKRNLRTATDIGDSKKLLLRGSVTFGGLELKSY
jgi:predicted membrane protein